MSRAPSQLRPRRTRRPTPRTRPTAEALEGRALLTVAVSNPLSFVEPVNLPPAVGRFGQILGVAKGDFNRDGKLDLVVSYNPSAFGGDNNQVAILAGNGDGTFGAPVTLPTPASQGTVNHLLGILARDFNKDGKVDLVVAEPDQQAILDYAGNGDGTFAAPTILPTGTNADTIQSADLNGDGTLDLVALNRGGNAVSVLLGNGDGTFAPPTVYSNVGDRVNDLAIGDVDGKNGPDLVLASFGNDTLNVLPNDGKGHFPTVVSTSFQSGGQFVIPLTVTAADFLGNGTTQVVVGTGNSPQDKYSSGYGGPAIALLKVNADGTFQIPADSRGFTPEDENPAHDFSENVAPDLNGDGKPDLLLGHTAGTNLVTIGLNRGDGTFALTHYVASPGPGPDVTPDQFNTRETADPGVVLSGDFHGTGVPDIVVGAFADSGRPGGLSILLAIATAPGTYASPRTFNTVSPGVPAPTGHSQLIGAFGPNGARALVSLAASNDNTSTRLLFLSTVNPDGTLNPSMVAAATDGGSGTFYNTLATADFNGDGKPDLVFLGATPSVGYVIVATNNGNGTFTPSAYSFPDSTNPNNVVVGDFNGDGKPDFAVERGAEVDIYTNNGQGGFTDTFQLPQGSPTGSGLAVGDFNGDGKLDVVANQSSNVNAQGNLVLFKGNGDGTFQNALVVGTPNGNGTPREILGADLRHNGRLDVVAIGNDLQVYLNNGDGTFAAPSVYPAGGSPFLYDFQLADLNGDGNLDAAVVGQSGLSVLTGNADGTFHSAQGFAVGHQVEYSVNIADVNGDGRPDILTETDERAGDATTVLLATPPPITDISSSITIKRGGFTYNRATHHYYQQITITNNSDTTFVGPIALVLDNLKGATLVNATGTTQQTRPTGSPYINILSSGSLRGRQSVTILLEFDDPSNLPITYTTRVLAGPGPR